MLRYYRKVDEGPFERRDAHGGDPTYWLEVKEAGDAVREIVRYPDGATFRYDESRREDELDGLAIMVVDGDDAVGALLDLAGKVARGSEPMMA